MDFNYRKPAHIVALIPVIIAFAIIIVSPIISFFWSAPSVQDLQIEDYPESFRLIFEIFALILQLVFVVIILFVGVPLLWYLLVNKLNFKEMLDRLKLRKEGIGMAILWGVITALIAFAIIVAIGVILSQLGYDQSDTSNIPELEKIFSVPTLFILITIQPIGEEIFFRGFLLEKINSLAGKEIAILSTAILFGIAHLSYGLVYTAAMTAVIGLIFAYVVIKTKNLYTSIVAHVLMNIGSFTIYLLGESFGF